jgi:hypothetical protein
MPSIKMTNTGHDKAKMKMMRKRREVREEVDDVYRLCDVRGPSEDMKRGA